MGFTLPDHTPQIYDTIPEAAWTPAYNTDGQPRQGADVAETRRPAGPDRLAQGDAGDHAPRAAPPGRPAALRGRGRLPTDRLRHQHKSGPARRPRGPPPATGPLPGDRIRCAKDTGLDRFPLQGFAQNRIWCLIVALARRPAGLLPAARHGLYPRPRLGAPHDPVAADEHPRCHRPPRPPHRPALQGRPPLHRPPACRTEQLSGPTRTIGTRPLPPAHHDPEGITLAPGKARPPRDDTRQTSTPNRHNQPHDTGNDATQTHSTRRRKIEARRHPPGCHRSRSPSLAAPS